VLDDGEACIACHPLAEATSDRAALARALVALSRDAELERGIMALTVEACELVPAVADQFDLFAPTLGEAERLRGVLGRQSDRYAGSLVRARPADPTAQQLERRCASSCWSELWRASGRMG
jgi:hypothetical protein